jgi:hypothetical protein
VSGAQVVQAACGRTDMHSQFWHPVPLSNGYFELKNGHSASSGMSR